MNFVKMDLYLQMDVSLLFDIFYYARFPWFCFVEVGYAKNVDSTTEFTGWIDHGMDT